MGISPELEKRFKINPLGTTVAIILTFLLLYFLQSTVGPFASNTTIRQNMVNLWDNTNWLLKVIWPLWGAFIVIGFLVDDKKTGRLRPVVISLARRGTGRLARTRAGQLASSTVRGGQKVIRREEEELAEFEEEESAE